MKIATIVQHRHLAERTVKRHLKLLEEGGYIRRERRGARGLYHYFFSDEHIAKDVLETSAEPLWWQKGKLKGKQSRGDTSNGKKKHMRNVG